MLKELTFDQIVPYNAEETIECDLCGQQVSRTIDIRSDKGPIVNWIYIQTVVKGMENDKYQDYMVDLDICPNCIPTWIESVLKFENTYYQF